MGADLLALSLAAALLLALAAAIWRARRRERRAAPRSPRLGRSGLHPDLSAALTAIVAGSPDRAIEPLRRIVQEDTDAIEVYVLLGDLYRELGQIERAVRIHRSVLQRNDLTPRQRASALAAAARDYEAAGFLDRAMGAYGHVARLRPEDPTPVACLRSLYEQARAWEEALEAQEKLVRLRPDSEPERRVLAYLHDRVGQELAGRGESRGARRHFERALAAWPDCAPALLHLGDFHYDRSRFKDAWRAWSLLLERAPADAWMVLERLDGLLRETGDPERMGTVLRDHATEHPEDWRCRAYLAGWLADRGQPREAREVLEQALRLAPSSVTVQRVAWRLAAEHGVTPEEAAAHAQALGKGGPFLDPLTCLHCRYRTAEPTWRCPHCQRWGTLADQLSGRR